MRLKSGKLNLCCFILTKRSLGREVVAIYLNLSFYNHQVMSKSKSVGLEKEDSLNQTRWRMGIGKIAVRVG